MTMNVLKNRIRLRIMSPSRNLEEGCTLPKPILALQRQISLLRIIEGTEFVMISLLFPNNAKSPFNSENRVKKTPQVIRLFSTIVPGKPELSVEQDEATVYVSWTLEDKNCIIKNYNVMYIRDDDSADMMNLTTKEMKQNFEDLRAGKTYEFQVRVSQ